MVEVALLVHTAEAVHPAHGDMDRLAALAAGQVPLRATGAALVVTTMMTMMTMMTIDMSRLALVGHGVIVA
jgi:hypothetical protein